MPHYVLHKLADFVSFLISKPYKGSSLDKAFFIFHLLSLRNFNQEWKFKYHTKATAQYDETVYFMTAYIMEVLVNMMIGPAWSSFPRMKQAVLFLMQARSAILKFKNTRLVQVFFITHIKNNIYFTDRLHNASWVVGLLLSIKSSDNLGKIVIYDKSGNRLTTLAVTYLFIEVNVLFIYFVFSLIKKHTPDEYDKLCQAYMQ